MSSMQRYTTELSTHVGTKRQIQGNIQSVDNILSEIKRQDEDEKCYFHSLNNRLEELLCSLNELELVNKKLRDDRHLLITNWEIDGNNRIHELDEIIRCLDEQTHRKIIFQVKTRIFNEQAQLTDRVTAVFIDVFNSYRDKVQIFSDLTNELEDTLHKIRRRLDVSDNQVKSYDDDYRKEIEKFRSYLSEWSQFAFDKQNLLNEIQSLRERYNLRLACNQEEINEWQHLLNHMSQESKNYYQDYLDTIKQKIQIDYEQITKEQQMDVEIQLKSRLKEIQDEIDMGLIIDDNDERRHCEEIQHFEYRLDESTKEHDRLQHDYQTLTEEIQHKRRTLQDLENELRSQARKHAEQHARLEYDTDLTRTEYYTLKDELDKLVSTLRFSVEEELRVYEVLLNSLQRKKEYLSIDGSKYRQTTTRYLDIVDSRKDSKEYPTTQPDITKITRFTAQTNIDSAPKYRTSPTVTETTTTKRLFDTCSSDEQPTRFQRLQPNISETTRKFTKLTDLDNLTKYRPLASSTETTTKQPSDTTIPIVRTDQAEKANNNWTYETISSDTTSSTYSEHTNRERPTNKTIIPTRIIETDRYGIQGDLIGQNLTAKTTTRRVGDHDEIRQQTTGIAGSRRDQNGIATISEVDEKFLQSRVHISRKYKGNILIKFVDINGRFVEIENTGNQPRDLTEWYIERTIDGRRIEYTFPVYELAPHSTVRIYGNYRQRSSSDLDDSYLQLIAPNFYDWGNGREIRTELFNRDNVSKALFEQTIRD